jgi:phosphonate transport system ATP-binding protein
VLGREVPALRAGALRAYRREVGLIYQQHGLVPALSVLHNVLLGQVGGLDPARSLLRLVYVPAAEVRAILTTLEELAVAVPLHRRAGDLSGGQQQRVAVARALWQCPRLLLADEPVASVDAETATAIMDALARRNERDGLTVVVALHQAELVRRYCRRVVVLEAGRIVYDGAPARAAEAAMAASQPVGGGG